MRTLLTLLALAGLACVFGFFSYAFQTAGQLEAGWSGGGAIERATMALGLLATGAVTGVLLWLAFRPSRTG